MRLRRLFAAATIVVLSAVTSVRTEAALTPGPLADLQVQLAAMSMHAPGRVGIMVEDLTTGLTSSINAGSSMPAASTIKIPVMVEVFRRLALGQFDLNRTVGLVAADRDWGSGDLCDAPAGSRYTVSRLLTLMITVSDNTATNMLIRLVGRSSINHTMLNLGLTQTKLTDFIRSEGPIRYALRSSPQDMIRLLDAMAGHRLVDAWSSGEMIAILSGQHHNGLIPEPLPPGTEIAHKTGELHDTLNDVGIVFLHEEPYAIAVMTTNLPTLDSGYRFIRGVSRLAYNELARFADWREANNVPQLPDALSATSPDVRMWTPPLGLPASAAPQEEGPPLPAATDMP
jgi:beta-lactamase class A